MASDKRRHSEGLRLASLEPYCGDLRKGPPNAAKAVREKLTCGPYNEDTFSVLLSVYGRLEDRRDVGSGVDSADSSSHGFYRIVSFSVAPLLVALMA